MPFQSRSQISTCYNKKGDHSWNCNLFLKETKQSICSLPYRKGSPKKEIERKGEKGSSKKRRVSKRTVSRIKTGPRGGKYRLITEKDNKGKIMCEYKLYIHK